MDNAKLYISLLNGYKVVDQRLTHCGVDGPIIGPVGVSFTYGSIKIHRDDWGDFELLPFVDNNLIKFNGIFYSDFKILSEGEVILNNSDRRHKLNYHEFLLIVHSVDRMKPDPTKHIFPGDVVVPNNPGSILAVAFHPEGELVERVEPELGRAWVNSEWYYFRNLRPLMRLSFYQKRYKEQLLFLHNAKMKTYYSDDRREEVINSIVFITDRFRGILERLSPEFLRELDQQIVSDGVGALRNNR